MRIGEFREAFEGLQDSEEIRFLVEIGGEQFEKFKANCYFDPPSIELTENAKLEELVDLDLKQKYETALSILEKFGIYERDLLLVSDHASPLESLRNMNIGNFGDSNGKHLV